MNFSENVRLKSACRSAKFFLVVFSFFVAVLFLVAPSDASFITSQNLRINLADSGEAQIVANLTYQQLSSDKVYYLVFAHVSTASAEDVNGKGDCSLETEVFGTQIVCQPLVENVTSVSNYSIRISFTALDLMEKKNSKRSFSYRLNIYDPTNELTVRVLLPQGMGIISPTENAFSPPGAVIGGTGRQVTLDWLMPNPGLGQSHTFSVEFEPLFGISFNYDYLYGILAVAIVLIIYFWYFRRSTRTKTILSVLHEKEKDVLEAILAAGDGIKQRDIVKSTSFSKAKVSRIISELEERGLIKTQRTGRTNKIFLTDKRLKKGKVKIEKKPEKEEDTKKEEPKQPTA